MPRPHRPFDLVVFDLDDTLAVAAGRYARALAVLPHYGVDPQRFVAAHERWWARYKSGRCSIDDLYVGRLADCGLTGAAAQEANQRFIAVSTAVRWRRGGRRLLATVRASGAAVAILTNGGSESQRRKAERMGLDGMADAILISEEIGVAKPAPAAFQAALDAAGAAPHRAAMVGDDLDVDVHGALAAGFARAVWVTAQPGTQAEGGVVRVAALAGVAGALGLEPTGSGT